MKAQLEADVTEHSLDFHELVARASEIADLIKRSALTEQYLRAKQELESDGHAVQLMKRFREKQQTFSECERYGHFHPDYNRAFDEAVAVQDELDALDVMKRFKAAEHELDTLFFEVSSVIAGSVSDQILVPNNFDQKSGSGGCGDGGCSGKCS